MKLGDPILSPTSLTKADIRRCLPIVSTLVRRDEWISAALAIQKTFEAEPFRQFILTDRHHPSIALAALFKRLKQTHSIPSIDNLELIAGMQLAYMIAHTATRLSTTARTRLAQKLHGSLFDQVGIRPLYFEMNVAHEFAQRGWEVGYEDLEGRAQFDFLVRRGGLEVEVECKFVQGDTGATIKDGDFTNLSQAVRQRLKDIEKYPAGLLINVTLDGKLGKAKGEQELIADTAALAFQGVIKTGGVVTMRSAFGEVQAILFDPRETVKALRKNPDSFSALTRNVVDGLVEGRSEHAISEVGKNGRMTIIACRSNAANRLVPAIARRMIDDAKGQFTQNRPAILYTQFANVTQKQILALQKREGVPEGKVMDIEWAMHKLFSRRAWVHTVVLCSREQIRPISAGYSTGGHTFTFVNRGHRLADHPALKLDDPS